MTGRTLGFCKHCNKEVNRKGKKFCSNKCQGAFSRTRSLAKVEETTHFPDARTARLYLLTKFGNKCMICGVETWTGQPVPLIMDHINGNSDDHSKENCRLVCRNCDGLLPTFCRKNKGYGGTKSQGRMKRYHQRRNPDQPLLPTKPITKRMETLKRIGHQRGEKNSMYGTRWIHQGKLAKRIPKDAPLPEGWKEWRTD